MTSSNISNVATGYQPGAVSKGNVDSAKKTEDAQAVFATLLGQTNLNVNQSNEMPKTESQSKAVVASTVNRQSVSEEKPVYQPKEQTRVKQADDTAKTVEKQAEALTKEAGKEIEQVMEEEFSVNEEQLQSVLEELGMNLYDLLNPAKLAQVVSKLTGVEDVSSLLMNENFVQVMQTFGEMTADIAGELGITAKELQQILTELPAGQTVDEVITPEQETVTSDIMSGEPQTVQTVAAEAAQPEDVSVQEDVKIKQNQIPDGQPEEALTEETVDESSELALQQPKEEAAGDETQPDNDSMNGQGGNETVFTRRSTQTTEHTTAEAGMAQHAVSGQINLTATEVPAAPSYAAPVDVAEVLQQIAEFVKVNVSSDTTSLEMQLNPENLGKLYLHISSNKDGNITASFTAQSEAVKEALETQLVELKQTLNQQGVKVDAIEVSVATHEFERNLEQSAEGEKQQGQQEEKHQGRRGLRMDSLDELSGVMTEEEQLAAQIMKDNGNSMDVTA